MSTRTNLRPTVVLDAGDMSGSLISAPTILQSISGVSYTVTWSGTSPVGTVSVQVSNDYSLNPDGTVANAGTWISLYLNVSGTPSTTVALSGNTGSGFLEIEKTNAYAIRFIYTRASGIGSLTAIIAGKVS